jgi:hypothetical protein
MAYSKSPQIEAELADHILNSTLQGQLKPVRARPVWLAQF